MRYFNLNWYFKGVALIFLVCLFLFVSMLLYRIMQILLLHPGSYIQKIIHFAHEQFNFELVFVFLNIGTVLEAEIYMNNRYK